MAAVESEWQQIVRYDWVVTRAWNRLHHVDLSDEQWREFEQDTVLIGSVRLSCGRIAASITVPGFITRMGAMRCAGCCKAVGYAPGKGSPKNDDECRVLLGLPTDGRI